MEAESYNNEKRAWKQALFYCATSHGGGENMSEQNEFGKVSAEELEKVFETEEQEDENE
ncbi:hypothetical protein K310107B6_23420 [Mediterraneibacter gnavus]|jgi:hypothetical protein